jgi:predicted ATPase/class 3 adenylate cyclase
MGAPGSMHAFLFTDVAGSTALWERFPREMHRAYARHDAIVRAAADAHHGLVFKVIGDAFQIAYPDANAALASATEMQRALCDEAWPLPMPFQIRMALHAGDIAPDAFGDFRSPILNRLGRLLGASHGGQILVSDAMAKRIEPDRHRGITLRSLGTHRLRDFPEAEPIYQVEGDGLPADFAPIVTAELRRYNLPAPPNGLIGRGDDCELITTLFEQSARLITLTGPGGAGKTRLALEAGHRLRHRWHDGVILVELAAIQDPDLLLPTIADTLGVSSDGEQTPGEAVTAWLTDRELLLVLDNFEQIIDAARDVARLLAAAPGLRILVTSREALHIRAERLLPVELLPVPEAEADDDLSAIAAAPAVQLFVERATAVAPRFTLNAGNARDIAAICRQVEGLPLAIELAAARIGMLSPGALLARLTHRLDLLTGGARDLPDRQQTLRATIGWSYDLLPAHDQALFRSLAVFNGGFDLAAATGVCGRESSEQMQDELHALIGKHLLNRVIRGDDERYLMLESVRAYALEALIANDEEPDTRRRHAGWYHQWLVRSTDLREPAGLNRLDTEHSNLRAAIAWADEAGEDTINLELAGGLARFWQFRGYITEGRSSLERALTSTPDLPSRARLTALSEAGTLANANGDYRTARERFEAALAMAESLNDQSAISAALNSIGGVILADGGTAESEHFFQRSRDVADAAGDRKRSGAAISNLGAVAHYRGDLAAARTLYEAALDIARERDDHFGIAITTGNLLILLAPFAESHPEALVYGEESLRYYDLLGDHQGKGYAFDGLGTIADANGDADGARGYYEQSLAQFQAAEDPSGIAKAIGGLGSVALLGGDLTGAAVLLRDSVRSYLTLEERDSVANLLDALAEIAATAGEYAVAAQLLGATEQIRLDLDVTIPAQSAERRQSTIALTRKSLGPETFTAMRAAGMTTHLEHIVALACSFKFDIDKARTA